MASDNKAEKKEIVIAVIAILLVLAAGVCLDLFFTHMYFKTSHLAFYFLSVFYRDSLLGGLGILSLVLYFGISMKKDHASFNLWKFLGGLGLIAAVIILIMNLFQVSDRYGGVLIENETPSKLDYKYAILRDVFGQETKVVDIPSAEVEVYVQSYSYKSGRSTERAYAYYMAFETADRKCYASLESEGFRICINELKELKDSIQIEYYIHSGIIKSIDGIDKNDDETLMEYIALCTEEVKRQKDQEEAEALRLKELEKEGIMIMAESEGKDITQVLQQFEELGIPFDYEIKYISSQMYEIDTIVLKVMGEVYVVEDNEKEDLLPIPRVALGMTAEEVSKLLTEAGFSYECSTYSCDLHEKGTLHGFQFPAGTLVPKGYRVGFSVDK